MDYASEKARQHANKGATAACVNSDTVFGWAIHYFEEDGIKGNLYFNEDGSKYMLECCRTAVKTTATPTPFPKPKSPFQGKPQMSMFDVGNVTEEQAESETAADDKPDEELADEPEEDGVVCSETETAAKEPIPNILSGLTGGMEVRCCL